MRGILSYISDPRKKEYLMLEKMFPDRSRPFVNVMNDMDTKDWLKFLKSWFEHQSLEDLYYRHVEFFTKPSQECKPLVYYEGNQPETMASCCLARDIDMTHEIEPDKTIDFALFDLLELDHENDNQEACGHVMETLEELHDQLASKSYVNILARNAQAEGVVYPMAWNLAKKVKWQLGEQYLLKDEKVGCLPDREGVYYSLFFRKEGD